MFTQKRIKESIILTALTLGILIPSFAVTVFAANQGGFSGPGPNLVTVKQALDMWDDSRVSIEGRVVKSLGDEIYLFQDATGSVEVEIDHDVWRGLTINPETVVVISGEIDKDWNHTEIEVSSISSR